MKRLCLAAGAPLLLSAAPSALAAETRKDVRCVISLDVWAALAYEEKDSGLADAAIAAKHYYLGRVDRSAPNLDLEQAIRAENRSMAMELYDSHPNGITEAQADALIEANLRERAKSCGQEFGDRAKRLMNALDEFARDPN